MVKFYVLNVAMIKVYRNFGSFQVHEIPARSGVDPQGNPYDAPERLTVEFNAEKQFRDRLAELSGKKVIA